MKVALYVRVSTKSQSVEMQVAALKSVAEQSGWDIVEIYSDAAVSGTVAGEQRPALAALLADAIRKRFDLVAIWSIDRLGRSTPDLMKTMQVLCAKNINLYAHVQAIDTSTPTGRMMWQLLGIFAEFEHALIKERVTAGIERARENGKRLGRPRLSKMVEASILEMRQKGYGMLKIGRSLNVGTSQVQRIVNAAECVTRATS